jgi:hypothetical protein
VEKEIKTCNLQGLIPLEIREGRGDVFSSVMQKKIAIHSTT